jgi:hypothetical protein
VLQSNEVNFLGKDTNTIKDKADTSRDTGLEISMCLTKYMNKVRNSISSSVTINNLRMFTELNRTSENDANICK